MKHLFLSVMALGVIALPARSNAVDCSGLDQWTASQVFTGGNQVRHNANAYRANWWTQNQDPETHSGPWQEWTLLDACDGGGGGGSNQPPTANANGPYSAKAGESVRFSSAGSSDADGNISQYVWDFGDGAISSGSSPLHSYANTGTYAVSLTVTDNDSATSTSSTTATILSGNGGGGGGNDDAIILGYFIQWGVYGRNYHVKNIVTSGSASRLTHINYAFGNVVNGRCVIGDSFADYEKTYTANDSVDGVADAWDSPLRGNFNQLRKLKQMYPGLKVLWSFGGWTWSGGFGQAANNPTAFANSCHDLIYDPRWADVFDGIDIDWEYPNDCGLSCDNSGPQAFANLVSALRTRFGSQLVTAAVTAGEAKIDATNYGAAAQYLDWYNVMTYDFFGAWNAQGPTAPHSPLFDYPGMPIAGFSTDHAVQVYLNKGIPKSKILVGIGFYGRGWSGVSQNTPGGSATGPAAGTYEGGIEDYKVLRATCPANGTTAGTAYAKCGSNWWSYDTPATIANRMSYIKSNGLRGTFFWELSGDTNDGELIQAIKNNLQ